jgi:hypothetical protein
MQLPYLAGHFSYGYCCSGFDVEAVHKIGRNYKHIVEE